MISIEFEVYELLYTVICELVNWNYDYESS